MESEPVEKRITSSETSKGSPVVSSSHHLFRSRTIVFIAAVVGVMLIAVASFAIGFSAGLHKARFSYRFGENYERNFIGPKHPEMMESMFRKMEGNSFRSGHGVVGEVLSIVDRTIAVRGPEGQENSIEVTDSTVYHKRGDRVNLEALSVGDRVAVLGKPSDDGTVTADLIRVFDLPGGGPPLWGVSR
ncbi:MAG: DUF5666 domain-containing protein [Candidatus Moraniibacteriota bacterium]